MSWLKDLFLSRIKEDVPKPSYHYECTVTYITGASDAYRFWAVDADDLLRLLQIWMPKRDQIVDKINIKRRLA